MNFGIEFHTMTCLNWNHLLKEDKTKRIITDSLKFLCEDGRIFLYVFVVMPNHIHLVWEVKEKWREKNIKQMFLKYTAQQIKFSLPEEELSLYKSTQADRQYHFWERRSWRATMNSREVLIQKLQYIHNNPVKAGLVKNEEDYVFSSSRFYNQLETEWNFLTHFMERA